MTSLYEMDNVFILFHEMQERKILRNTQMFQDSAHIKVWGQFSLHIREVQKAAKKGRPSNSQVLQVRHLQMLGFKC